MSQYLTEFAVHNIAAVLLALVPALLNLGIVIYILAYLPPRTITRVFALFTFALFLWQLEDVLARTCNTEGCIRFWDDILSIGWIGFAPLGLYFTLLYTGYKAQAKKAWLIVLVFFPPAFFEGLYNTDAFPHDFEYHPFWGWVNFHNQYFIDEFSIIWLAALAFISMVLHIYYAWKTRYVPVLNKQALLIAAGISIPVVQGLITQVISPIAFGLQSIPVTSATMSTFAIATVIAFSRYRLFSLTEIIHAESILQSLSEIVFTITPDKRIVYVNPYARETLRLDPGKHTYQLPDLFKNNDLSFEFEKKVVNAAFAGKHVENLDLEIIVEKRKPICTLVTANPIHESGKIIGLLIVAYDITEIREAEKEVREKNVALERSNKELETFAFVASHDLKEPLRMVSNYTQLLATRYENALDADARDFIRFAVEGVHRMQALINDLLEYSRIGKNEIERAHISLTDILGEVKQTLAGNIEASGALVEYPQQMPVLYVHKGQVVRLFQNLIENALKFVAPGVQPHVRISVTPDTEREWWRFSISDNGIGILPAYKDKVFVLFQRLNERDQYPGTGLGLSICKKIVELHGGKIWFDSTPQKGTTFYFTLSGKPPIQIG